VEWFATTFAGSGIQDSVSVFYVGLARHRLVAKEVPGTFEIDVCLFVDMIKGN
jgi:hypothetical protein